jgi:hypothetical protein
MTCTCREIQAADPRRHFRGCEERGELPELDAAKVTKLCAAAKVRLDNGCSATCPSRAETYRDLRPCDCGHEELRRALREIGVPL